VLTAMMPVKFERFFMVDFGRESQRETDTRSKREGLPPAIQSHRQGEMPKGQNARVDERISRV
jgi:hypothetical protein